MYVTADMTNNASTEVEFTFDNCSTSDLGIVMLIVAVVAILCNFLFSIAWIQFFDQSIIIAPAIIGFGLMLHFNLYFKRTLLKIITAESVIVKRLKLNNNLSISFALNQFISALTIINVTVKIIYSTSDAAKNFVAKKPVISTHICAILASIYYILMGLSYRCRTVEAAYISLMILTASFNHFKFAGGFVHLLFVGIIFTVLGIVMGTTNVYYENADIIIAVNFVILIFCFIFSHDLHSSGIICIAITHSIATFTYDLISPFVDIPDFVTRLFFYLLLEVSILHFAANDHFMYYYYLRIHEYYSK